MFVTVIKRYLEIPVLVFMTFFMMGTAAENPNDKLIREVWKDYHSEVRPICGEYPGSVKVKMGIALRQLMELDEPKQIFWSSIWFRLSWEDCRLLWNTSDYGGSVRITVPRPRVWTPDLTLYDKAYIENFSAESQLGKMEEYRINVNHTGHVTSLVPVVIKSMCQLNVLYFPFDRQNCHLTFGSWAYNGYELNLTTSDNPTDLGSYIEHGEWDVLALTHERIERVFPDGPYPQVIFTVHLSRKPLFYAINLLFPSLLLNSLAVFGFLLPPESGEKVNLEITVLLSLSVFQLVVLDAMPATSENIPIVAIYFMCAMILVTLSCVSTVGILNIHFTRHHHQLPSLIKALLTGRVGKIFRVSDLMKAVQQTRVLLITKNSSDTNGSIKHRERRNSHNLPKQRRSSDAKYGFVSDIFSDSGADQPSGSSNEHIQMEESPRRRTYCYADGNVSRHESPRSRQIFSTDSSSQYQVHSSPEMSDVCQTSSQMLFYLQKVSDGKTKKLSHDLRILEWRIFALFLDRLFLNVFLCLSLTLVLSVYCIISTS